MAAVAAILRDSQVDIVSLQEVETLEMLSALRDQHGLAGRFPYMKLIDGNDARKGYDVAILSRYPITRFETHKDKVIGSRKGEEQKFRRDLLEVDVALPNGQNLRVFANHFIAKPGEPYCDEIRLLEAKKARQIVLEQAKKFPTDHFVIMGDFNDREDREAMRIFHEGELRNVSLGLPSSWGEIWKTDREPSRLDHIIADARLAGKVKNRAVYQHPQEAWASDHRLVYVDVDFEGQAAA
jgi:endonuclease/exonuclease/phosphatase family metal-dependent hydrolase